MVSAANHERDLPLGELIVRAGLVASNELYAALASARASASLSPSACASSSS